MTVDSSAAVPDAVRPEVLVVRTGTANLASVLVGLRRAGAAPRITDSADEVASAKQLVLPGVGAFAAAMRTVRDRGLVEILAIRIKERRPTLCICLGMQILSADSEESPGVPGLGVMACRVGRFPGTVRVPQLGWNRVTADPACKLLQPGWAYFANSYRLSEQPPGWAAAFADHGGSFVAAVESGPVLACQFHPELSGVWGLELLRRWVAAGRPAECGRGAIC